MRSFQHLISLVCLSAIPFLGAYAQGLLANNDTEGRVKAELKVRGATLQPSTDPALERRANVAFKSSRQVLRFQPNAGQIDNPNVLYRTVDAQAIYFFEKDRISAVVTNKADSTSVGYAMQFVGSNPGVAIQAGREAAAKDGVVNYITPNGAFPNLKSYYDLQYQSLWKGIDAQFYESDGSMKYDFVVQPQADPAQVRFRLDGATNIKVNAKGELEFTTPFGTLQKGKPYSYQRVNGKEVEVKTTYVVDNGEVSFKIGTYDPALPLIIDPIALKWCTFLTAGINNIWDMFVDNVTGRIYFVGNTTSVAYPNTLGRPYGGGGDAFVTCMEKDGTTLVWSTYIGGSGSDDATAISVDAAGDVYVEGRTNSTNFPVNGTVGAYNAFNSGSQDIVLFRLNSTGTTLKYSTYLGGTGFDGNTICKGLVVDNGTVYFGSSTSSTNFPTTAGAFQSSSSNTNLNALYCAINTNVAGSAGLKYSTYVTHTGNSNFISMAAVAEDKDGNIWFAGWGTKGDLPMPANAIQKAGDFLIGSGNYTELVFKFSKAGQYLYGSYVNPFWTASSGGTTGSVHNIALDADGNVYVTATMSYTAAAAADLITSPAITTIHELTPLSSCFASANYTIGTVVKIPYSLTPNFEFVSVIPQSSLVNNDPQLAVDKKGNIHIVAVGGGTRPYVYPFTQGALSTYLKPNGSNNQYYVLSPSGSSVLYGSTIGRSAGGLRPLMISVNDKCEAYIAQGSGGFITPSYRDPETNSQKSVYNAVSTGGTTVTLSVFHEPKPNNNTITEFAPGNNTFCVNGAIYQNPNDGPILGSTPTYQSGDGSSALHNLPNFFNGPVLTAHPTPGSPAIQYQWQKSRNGGVTWTNVGNGTFDVYKPEPEPTSGTVQYRRLVKDICGSVLDSSNVAHATLAGNFNMQITSPTKPVYYCPAVAGTSLGTSVSNSSGNISWQWYDGYSPLTGNGIISPSSGSGPEASFTAMVGTSATAAGIYRLVVTDAGGCKKEAFVSIVPKTASPGSAPTIQLCPGGVTSVTLGPPAINPDFVYSWTGPGGFTSSSPNPVVTVAGTYTLQVRLTTDAGFCAPGTSITINAATPHAAILVPMPDKEFCQPDPPGGIGLSGASPAGYVFQWSPGSFIDNQTAFNPKFDPGFVPTNGFPIGTVTYNFTALRLSDGCVYEDQMVVTDTARALAQAGDDRPAFCTTTAVVGAPETTGGYFRWRAVGTTFPGGVAALTADPAFLMDGVATNLGTQKYLTAGFPSGAACYTIDYELRAAYVPFPTNCYTKDTVRVFVCPCSGGGGGGSWCSILTSNSLGTAGACSGTMNWIGSGSVAGLDYTWETESVDGVTQVGANRAPRGLFYLNPNGTKGAALPIGGAHPSKAIADFDDVTWGWPGANVVIYKLTASQNYGAGIIDCPRFIQVFSSANSTPVIGIQDKTLCTIPAPGIKLGSSGFTTPYAVSGIDYTQAPNSAFIWTWSGGPITMNGTTPYPTINPLVGTTPYYVTVRDPMTGCVAKDSLIANVNKLVTNAGVDYSGICPGSLVQLGTPAVMGLTYSWSPTAGLNYPIGTPNSMTAQPYLTVPNIPAPPAALTYTVTVTDAGSGCQATDAMVVNTTTTPPPAIAPASYTACPGAIIPAVGPGGTLAGATYAWTIQSGSANLAWLSATDVRQPIVTLPANFSGPAVFRLTVTKGTCGSVFADYTINDLPALPSLGGPFTATCTSPLIQLGSAAVSGYTYQWYPATGLFTDAAGTTAYVEDANLAQPYARPTGTTTYTLVRTGSYGCSQTATVTVDPPVGSTVNAGPDRTWCPGAPAITINGSGTGTTLTWTAIGYSANPNGPTPTTIAAPMTSGQMLGYLSSTSTAITSFNQSSVVVGQYVYRLTSVNGACTISDDVVIKVPNVPSGIAGLSQNVCLGSSVQLGATGNPTNLNYNWTALNPSNAGATISDPTAARPFVTPTVNTTYQVVYTDASTGCSDVEQVSVVINPKPVIADAVVPVACGPIAPVNLTAQISGYAALFNPVWYTTLFPGGPVVNTPTSVTPVSTTTYYLVAESDLGCLDTAQVTVNVANPQTPNVQPSVTVSCNTYSVNLALYQGSPSQSGYTLEWHNANNTNASTLLSSTIVGPGTYYLFEKAPAPTNCYSASDNIVVIPALCPNPDLGDLPDTGPRYGPGNYQTLLANNGPTHVIKSTIHLGSTVDNEPNGQPSTLANGDGTDEDGVSFPTFTVGQSAVVNVTLLNTTSRNANLYGFIDWNNDGDFNDAGEAPAAVVVSNGATSATITFNVPTNAVISTNLGARFRFTTDNLSLLPQASEGPASDGEVEDYLVQVISSCATITNPSAAQNICEAGLGSDITVQTNSNTVNSIRFVRFNSDQMSGAAPTAAEAQTIYAAPTLGAPVTPSGAGPTYTATLTAATAGWATTAPGVYYVYAILNPDPGASCRPVQEIIVTIVDLPTITTTPGTICAGATINLASLVTGNTPAGALTFYGSLAAANSATNPLANTTVAPVVTTTYYVRSQMTSLCYTVAPVTVTVNTAPTFSVTNGSVCAGGSINLASLVTNSGGGTLSYHTSLAAAQSGAPALASSTVSPASATNYYVRSTNGSGCFTVKELTVTIQPVACGTIQITNNN